MPALVVVVVVVVVVVNLITSSNFFRITFTPMQFENTS